MHVFCVLDGVMISAWENQSYAKIIKKYKSDGDLVNDIIKMTEQKKPVAYLADFFGATMSDHLWKVDNNFSGKITVRYDGF